MKLSKIMRPISVSVFLFAMMWYVLKFPGESGTSAFWAYLLTIVVAIVCYLCRSCESKVARFATHVAFFVGYCYVAYRLAVVSELVAFMLAVYIILSLIAGYKSYAFLDKTYVANTVILVVFCTGVIAQNNANPIIAFLLFVLYFSTKFIQDMSIRNENYLDVISTYSVFERDKIQRNTNRVSLCVGLATLVLCAVMGFIGRASVFKPVNDRIDKISSGIIKIISEVKFNTPEPEDEPIELPPENDDEMYSSNSTFENVMTWIFKIIFIGLVGFYALKLGYRIYKFIHQFRLPVEFRPKSFDEEFSLELVDEKKEEERREKRVFSNKKLVRKLYRNRIKKGRGLRSDDLNVMTPKEHQSKKISEGYIISDAFVEIYEKARYSNDEITKEDLSIMKVKH